MADDKLSPASLWYKDLGINSDLYDFFDSHKNLTPVEKSNLPSNKNSKIEYLNSGKVFSTFIIESDDTNVLMDKLDKINNLSELYKLILDFDCELKKFSQNTVIYEGVSDAKLMLIGEAPGQTEDIKGVPFCGESGELLDIMLSRIGYSRKENTYITNSLFWRPPANRPPTTEEILSCRPIVEKHISLIQPKLLVLVGATAIKSVLGNQAQSISLFRGKYINYQNKYLDKPIALTCIFHPSYLLRQGTKKKVTWFDLINIKKFLDAN
jgi:uracil-DNA glycosylase family 4